ncbi:hypothetical protein [Xenorhabdus kozodoii]|uniref:Uncharacterized protein n=1 Tax=Xenorhabdus kozodoii TaxID=351676 RepID=A0A2D0L176_9GAMM|nr:hypothetical protein [Xenorhabdus kozodoii]PHM69431.1 hypothetical protein Xkoz_03398 [Xenorhabdus kozodoii]
MINNKIEISINKKADLVIGQSVSFTITLNSDTPIASGKAVTIKNSSANIKFDQDITQPILLNYQNSLLTAFACLSFTVLEEVKDIPVQDGSDIYFEVHTDAATSEGDFNVIKFTGKANEIDVNSLALFVEKPYLKTVVTGDDKPSEKDNFTAIHTILKSISGKILVGTPIFVTSSVHHKMNDFQFKDANNKQEILPEKIGPNEGISISSDQHGLVKFYLYPKVSEVTSLVLQLVILNDVADIRAKKILYVANYINPGYMDSIGTPDIAGFSMGDLFANQGLAYFLTTVSSYDNVAIGDVVLFFVNGNYTGYSVTIEDEKKQLDQPSIRLPYTIFERDVLSEFSYTVIKEGGDALYSLPLPLNYVGGVPYEPESEVKRSYDMCIVHPSIGVDPNIAIPPVNSIGYDNIMKYPGYTYNGLFIEIIRSQDNDSKAQLNPVPLDITDITLNMYINSDNKSFTKPYTKQISLTEIGGPGNKDSIYFHIPYEDIVGINWRGNISFDYQFFKDETIQYSAVWDGYIGTTPPPGYN